MYLVTQLSKPWVEQGYVSKTFDSASLEKDIFNFYKTYIYYHAVLSRTTATATASHAFAYDPDHSMSHAYLLNQGGVVGQLVIRTKGYTAF